MNVIMVITNTEELSFQKNTFIKVPSFLILHPIFIDEENACLSSLSMLCKVTMVKTVVRKMVKHVYMFDLFCFQQLRNTLSTGEKRC